MKEYLHFLIYRICLNIGMFFMEIGLAIAYFGDKIASKYHDGS